MNLMNIPGFNAEQSIDAPRRNKYIMVGFANTTAAGGYIVPALDKTDNLACDFCLDNCHWGYIEQIVGCRDLTGGERQECFGMARNNYSYCQANCFYVAC